MCNREAGKHSNYGSETGSDTVFGRLRDYFQASSTTSMAFTMA
jgi:hypothetical protein